MTTTTRPAKTSPTALKRTMRVLSPFAATIRITQQRGNGRPEVIDYTVEFVPVDATCGPCGVVFRKVSTEPKPRGMTSQTYCVLVNRDGLGESCDCTGSAHHGKCKHRDLVPVLLKLRRSN